MPSYVRPISTARLALLLVPVATLAAGLLPAGAQTARGPQAEPAAPAAADGLTREQLAGLYPGLAGAHFDPPACVAGDETFTDVPATSPFCPWIEELARRGVTTGCTATEYCPGDRVSRSQMAVSGTPDHPGPCNTDSGSAQNAGANAGCISDWGVNDMVGNVSEWVADWMPFSTSCPDWGDVGDFSSDDSMCLSGASTSAQAPSALVRGGGFGGDLFAGPFAVPTGGIGPQSSFSFIGFRGAR